MDGYTIEEAASVLGVPRERVWELIARGILSAYTDLGGAMRVRLKAEPAPAPVTPAERPPDAPPPASFDMNPFRELLTEFRSLTERYGQALLALGEARGEVAGLRSRVDMLEARVEVRLPSTGAPLSSSWDAAPWPTPRERVDAPVEPVAEPAEAAEPEAPIEAEPATDAADDAGAHRRRGRRRATESFADALARADDPSPPELPGAAETAAALAGLRQAASDEDADASLPREVPSAEEMPVAEEEERTDEDAPVDGAEDAEREEPDDDDAAWGGARVAAPEPSPEPERGTQPEDAAEEPEDAADDAVAAELSPEPAPEEAHAADATEADREAEPAEWRSPVAASEESGDQAWDANHYSTDIEEPGWISADDVAVQEPVAYEPPRPEAPRAPSAPGSMELSGSRELDEALAALDALAHPESEADAAAGDRADDGPPHSLRPAGGLGSEPPRPAWPRTTAPPQLVMRSPASRAYRRLKRIFPT